MAGELTCVYVYWRYSFIISLSAHWQRYLLWCFVDVSTLQISCIMNILSFAMLTRAYKRIKNNFSESDRNSQCSMQENYSNLITYIRTQNIQVKMNTDFYCVYNHYKGKLQFIDLFMKSRFWSKLKVPVLHKNHSMTTVSTIMVHNAPCKRTDPCMDLQTSCCEEGKHTDLGLSEILFHLIALGGNPHEPGLRVAHTTDLVGKEGFGVTAFQSVKEGPPDLQMQRLADKSASDVSTRWHYQTVCCRPLVDGPSLHSQVPLVCNWKERKKKASHFIEGFTLLLDLPHFTLQLVHSLNHILEAIPDISHSLFPPG